jgi:thiamine biosynthesis lipoprotein
MVTGDLPGVEGKLSSAVGATAFDAWSALGMLVQLVVTPPRLLPAARELLEADLLALDLACSRFRPDSELVAIGNVARGAAAPVTVTVSPLLAEAVAVSLRAAQLTDGDVDPTVGGALAELGYDRDFAELTRPEQPEAAGGNDTGRVSVRVIPGWRSVRVDVDRQRLTVPAGVQLDLGATVKGWAADRAAARIAQELGCGVLVSLGGDTAVAGEPPAGGWRIPVWRTVSVAAVTCADANTAATAAVIRGRQALPWLAGLRLPARLVAQDGAVHTLNAWPADNA